MVYLDADKQTYADLNVTGNVYGEQARNMIKAVIR